MYCLLLVLSRGAGATGAAGATAPVAETVRGRHGGDTGATRGRHGGDTGATRGRHGGDTGATGYPFSPELRFEICALFT
jgi:hypothetical protein